MRLPIAAVRRPRSSPAAAGVVLTTIAASGTPRRSTVASRRDPGSTRSRATEYIVRAVRACADMPHARNAISTTAANGFADEEPNELTTAVVTGSRSRPATTAAGSGCASVAATALRITIAPTLSIAAQIRPRDPAGRLVRLLRRRHAGVEADEHPAADREGREQPGAGRP